MRFPGLSGCAAAVRRGALLRRLRGRLGVVADLALLVFALALRAGRDVDLVLRVDRSLEILDRPAEAIAELRQLRRPEDDDDNDEDEQELGRTQRANQQE